MRPPGGPTRTGAMADAFQETAQHHRTPAAALSIGVLIGKLVEACTDGGVATATYVSLPASIRMNSGKYAGVQFFATRSSLYRPTASPSLMHLGRNFGS